ncbi:putative signal transducing protein [Eubacterium oxidoreducens]|uniref:Putative signal transducing protein n=1 Tax=Eubacterium oxidoreducens TaxID=1732 RepID=A0A1G6B5K8_EUBOX|nr:DUF2007 domain-containing protein [Eubacterium oxidoreducens]SDB15881.1 Putative signal transducing protein [Eubacterium oxidoreducens]
MKELITVNDDLLAESLLSELKKSNIPGYISHEGAGQYLKILTGNSIYGKTICVNETDYERAVKLLKQLNFIDST